MLRQLNIKIFKTLELTGLFGHFAVCRYLEQGY